MEQHNTLKKLILTALFAALIALLTAYLQVPIMGNGGYIHFGDALIFLAASILPAPYAVAAAAIGGGLADLLAGAAVWMPFTVVAKGMIALLFTSKKEKILCKRNWIAPLPALAVTVGVYYLAEALLYGDWVAPIFSQYGNVIQIAGSAAVYYVLAKVFDKSAVRGQLGIRG